MSESREEDQVNGDHLMRSIIDSIELSLYWKDAHLHLIGANKALLKEHGVRNFHELDDNDLFQGKTLGIDQQVAETNRAVLHREFKITTDNQRERILSLSSVPLFSADGVFSGILGSCTDITESNRYREELRQGKNFLSGLVEALPVGFFAKDPRSGFSYRIWNRKMEEIFGYSPERAVESRDWNLFGASAAELLETHDRELLENIDAERKPEVYQLRSMNGLKTVSIVRVPLYDDLLDSTLVAGTVDDITRENQLEEQLRQSQKMDAVGRLAGGVAHDFNNLLQVIMGAAEIGSTSTDDPGSYFAQILLAGEKAMSLTGQLLSFSRDGSFKSKPFEVDRRVGEFIQMIHRIVEASIKLTFEPGASSAVIQGDPFQLEQVLMNLIVNARDALEGYESGRIDVATSIEDIVCNAGEEAKACVVISVSDNGPGISKDLQNKIFEPFFTTKKQGKGTGLGLASSYGIVVKHGGTIQVNSVLEEGSQFRVCIPVFSSENVENPGSEPGKRALIPEKKLTVLLAEDEEMVREIAGVVLRRAGHRVIEAVNGKEAYEMYSLYRDQIDIAIFDAMMPEMNGRDAFEKILELSPDLPCLFCTGYSGDSLLAYFDGRARVGVLQKPYAAADLLGAAEDLTRGN